MKNLLIIICCLLSLYCSGQKMIIGKVVDIHKQPIEDILIEFKNDSTKKFEYDTCSDKYGVFHFVVTKPTDTICIISFIHKPVYLSRLDTLTKPIEIIMQIDSLGKFVQIQQYFENKSYWQRLQNWNERGGKIRFYAGIGMDFYKLNYNSYSSILGNDKIKLLNQNLANPFLFVGLEYFRLQTNFIWGGSFQRPNSDSLNLKINRIFWGLNLGFKIINRKNWIVIPNIEMKTYRTRLISSEKGQQSLNQYLTNRNLDIDFSKTVYNVGLNIAYKLYNTPLKSLQLGLYGNYTFNYWNGVISNSNTTLITNAKISSLPYNLGFQLSYFFRN